MNFVAIDFETAIGHHICSVGLVEVIEGKIVDLYHTLIQPPRNQYNWHNIQVHGISEFHTRNAPTFDKVFPELQKRLQNKLVVAHNETFDRTVLQKTMADYQLNYDALFLPTRWECTYKIYKQLGYKPAKLDACCARHHIELKHHDALSDAKACAELYLIAQSKS